MSREFRLDGLLRLRRLQQDQAAGRLSAANRAVMATQSRSDAARIELGLTPVEVENVHELAAVACARAAAGSALADLKALSATREVEAGQARDAYAAARKNTLSLEKLAERHQDSVRQQDLADEQRALDELAGRRKEQR